MTELAHPERLQALSDAADYLEKIGARYHSGRDIANGIRCLAPRSPDVAAWRPIETAPKDGTPIICFTPDENFSEKTGFDLIWWEPSEGAWFYGAADFFSASPTHWIPLPRSPQSGAEQDK